MIKLNNILNSITHISKDDKIKQHIKLYSSYIKNDKIKQHIKFYSSYIKR